MGTGVCLESGEPERREAGSERDEGQREMETHLRSSESDSPWAASGWAKDEGLKRGRGRAMREREVD